MLPESVTGWIGELAHRAKKLWRRQPSDAFGTADDWRLMKFCRMLDHVGLRIESEPGPAMFEELAVRVEEDLIRMLQQTDDRSL